MLANAHVVLAAQGTSFGLTDIRGQVERGNLLGSGLGHRRTARAGAVPDGRSLHLLDAGRWLGIGAPGSSGIQELDDRAPAVAGALANANPDAVRAALQRDLVEQFLLGDCEAELQQFQSQGRGESDPRS